LAFEDKDTAFPPDVRIHLPYSNNSFQKNGILILYFQLLFLKSL